MRSINKQAIGIITADRAQMRVINYDSAEFVRLHVQEQKDKKGTGVNEFCNSGISRASSPPFSFTFPPLNVRMTNLTKKNYPRSDFPYAVEAAVA